MKILIATDWYAPTVNGVVTSVLNLERRLRERGHEVRVLTVSEKLRSHKTDTTYYIRSVSAPIYPEARIGFVKHRYYKEIVEWAPDIIHTQCEFSTYIMALAIAKKLQIPVVHTYHTVYEEYTHYFCPSKKLGKVVVSVLTRNLLKPVKAVIAPTEKVKNLLAEYNVHKELYVLPTGIELERFEKKLSEKEKAALRQELEIPSENKIMLFLGRLAKEKNVSEIIEYFKELNRSDVTLLIAGGGPYFKELKAEAEEKCQGLSVIFTGMIKPDDVWKYYKLGNFFVSASTSETQGLTYIEALANSLPALCRKDPCIDGVVKNNINGFQYESFDEFKTFAEKILDDEAFRKEMSEAAYETAQGYSTQIFAEKAEKIYLKALSQI
ncbi:MAG: glycosyltransferase family 4 protein [Clostridiales bacterium]|nr:glycosyltransferase family 4 protein [Clostridiales bacterium]